MWGWHVFVYLEGSKDSDHLWRCVRCHGIVSEWELSEGFWKNRLGSVCPEFLLGLPSAERRTTTMTTLADIKAQAELDIQSLDEQILAATDRKKLALDELKELRAQRAEAHRILSALTPRTRKRKDTTTEE
jgi:hypothetical protein